MSASITPTIRFRAVIPASMATMRGGNGRYAMKCTNLTSWRSDMRNLSLTLLAVGLLSACTTYTDTLEAKLAGKSQDEKRTILAQECAQEIKNGLKPQDEANVRHFERMRKICEEMTGKK